MNELNEKKFYVKHNRCSCHPETCCCSPWVILDPKGEKYLEIYSGNKALEIAACLTMFVAQYRVSDINRGKIMRQQKILMQFDPATGERNPIPNDAEKWRSWHGKTIAWLFDPWTGIHRNAADVGSDTFGHLIIPPNEKVFCEVTGPITQAELDAADLRAEDLLDFFTSADDIGL